MNTSSILAFSCKRTCIVAGGVLIEKGKVLMVYHEKLKKWLYPGGHVEPNETPVEAAKREFKEESGLDVEVIGYKRGIKGEYAEEMPLPFVTLIEYVPYPDGCHIHYDLVFLVKRINGNLTSNAKFFELDSLPDTIDNVRLVILLASREYASLL